MLILLLGGVVLIGCVEKMNGLLFYPRIVFRKAGWLKIPVYGAFTGLCLSAGRDRASGGMEMETFVFEHVTFSLPGL